MVYFVIVVNSYDFSQGCELGRVIFARNDTESRPTAETNVQTNTNQEPNVPTKKPPETTRKPEVQGQC